VGYKRNPKVYKLIFDDTTDYPGLEVQVGTISMGQLIAMRTGNGDKDSAQAGVESFAERIVSWNLEDENGQPVPTTLEAILGEDDDLIIAIIKKWNEAMAGVAAPLPQSSPAGELSAVESIPMAPLSESLVS
jgi:hypothetical protein